METHWQSASLIQHPIYASPARRQPHPAETRRWRRQSVQMGRQICVCLSRCNPWRDISSGVGNSSAQTVDDHLLVNGRTRKRSAAGGMERSGSLCGRVAAPQETLHRVPWREPLQQLWKATCRKGAASGSGCWQGAPSGSSCRQG